MFDDSFDMFDRDEGRGRAASDRRGWRGFLARMFGGDDDTRRTRQARYRNGGDDDRDEGRAAPRHRRRDDDGFDFGD